MNIFIQTASWSLIAALTVWLYTITPNRLKKWLILCLLIQLAAGILLSLYYIHLLDYDGDAVTLHKFLQAYRTQFGNNQEQWFDMIAKGRLFPEYELPLSNGDSPRLYFMLRMVSFFALCVGGGYWNLVILGSWLAFAGAWIFILTLHKYYIGAAWPAIIAFFLTPASVLWSSGLLKESFIRFSMLTALSAVIYLVKSRSFFTRWHLAALISAPVLLYVTFQIKFYYAAVLIPCLAVWVFMELTPRRYWLTGGGALAVMMVVAVSFLNPLTAPEKLFNTIYQNHLATYGDSFIHFHLYNGSAGSALLSIPEALSTLVRPLPGEVPGVAGWATGIQNLLLTAVFGFAASMAVTGRVQLSREALLCMAYVAVCSWLIPLSSPNFGTLERYKTGYLPFLVMPAVYAVMCYFKNNRLRKMDQEK